jgi:hypothetical protein
MRWLAGFAAPPTMTWCVHGEAAAALRDGIRSGLGWRCEVAADGARTPV